MNPFYKLNKTLAGIDADKQTISESKTVTKSSVQTTLEDALRTDLRNLMEDGTGGANFSGSGSLEEKTDKSLSKAAKTIKKGALHKQEGIPQDKKIGDKKLQSLKKSGTPLEKKRANFALNIQGKGKKKVNEWGGDPNDPTEQHYEMIESWYDAVADEIEKNYSFSIEFPMRPSELAQIIDKLTKNISNTLGCPPDIVKEIIESINFEAINAADSEMDECDMHGQKPMDTNPRNKDWDAAALQQHKSKLAREMPKLARQQQQKSRHPDDLEESEDEILSYLKDKIAPQHHQARSMSRPYNGSAGAADAYNGMEFEETANGPHGKPGWLIDAEKDAERRAGHDVDESAWPGIWEPREPEADTHPRHNVRKTSTGTVYSRKHEEPADDEVRGPGGQAGSTRGSYGARTKGSLIKSHMKSREMEEGSEQDYSDEGETFKNSLHTVIRVATHLDHHLSTNSELPEWVSEKMGAIKGMLVSVMDYLLSDQEMQHDPDAMSQSGAEMPIAEKSTSEKQARTMAAAAHNPKFAKKVGIKGSVAKEFNKADKGTKQLSNAMKHKSNESEVDEEKAAAGQRHFFDKLAPAAKKVAKVVGNVTKGAKKEVDEKKESTSKSDGKAEKAGKKVTKDIEYDEKKKDGISGKKREPEDNKAEKAGKRVTKDIEHDEKKVEKKAEPKKPKEEKVEETTTSGSVAPSTSSKSSGGMGIGQGIYDSWEHKYTTLLSEGISITNDSSKGDDGEEVENITISVSGDDVSRMKEMLHNMGISHGDEAGHENGEEPCDSCGGIPCQCDEMVEANQHDADDDSEQLVQDYFDGKLDWDEFLSAAIDMTRVNGTINPAGVDNILRQLHDPQKSNEPITYDMLMRHAQQDREQNNNYYDDDDHQAYNNDTDYPAKDIPKAQFEGDMEEDDTAHKRMMELAGLEEADATYTENEPDYPTNQEESDDAMQYSGGLNGKKSTGQTTIPVLASQEERQMSESDSFLNLYKAFSKIKI